MLHDFYYLKKKKKIAWKIISPPKSGRSLKLCWEPEISVHKKKRRKGGGGVL